jgi:hypothetical protein
MLTYVPKRHHCHGDMQAIWGSMVCVRHFSMMEHFSYKYISMLCLDLERVHLFGYIQNTFIIWSQMFPFKNTQTKSNTLFSIDVNINLSDLKTCQGGYMWARRTHKGHSYLSSKCFHSLNTFNKNLLIDRSEVSHNIFLLSHSFSAAVCCFVWSWRD